MVHGTADNLITFPHMDVLLAALGGEDSGVTKVVFDSRGHYLPLEERKEFREVIESMIDKTERLQ